MRGAVLVLLLSGCSSQPAAPPDLAAVAPDLSAAPGSGCTFVLGGDASGMDSCHPMLCRSSASSSLLRLYNSAIYGDLGFAVVGDFTPGHSYTVADLYSFDGFAEKKLPTFVRYGAGNAITGSTASLTLTDVDPSPPSCPSGGTVHGTAHAELIELLTDDGGTRPPGRITIDAVF